jgi:hypothetical protein
MPLYTLVEYFGPDHIEAELAAENRGADNIKPKIKTWRRAAANDDEIRLYVSKLEDRKGGRRRMALKVLEIRDERGVS